jgi:TPR repeat protein
MTMLHRCVWFVVLALCGAAGSVLAAENDPAVPDPAVAECDRAAAHPDDPQRVGTGVDRSAINLSLALSACGRAVASDPANGRVRYQFARVLFYTDDAARAIEQMRIAADAGYPQAQFVFGTFITRGRPGAPTDICLAERYWWQAANSGRQAARVQYLRFALRGRFSPCPQLAAAPELRDIVVAAAAAARDFYERLLVEDLAVALAERSDAHN